MKIAVTSASGQLGTAIVKQLIAEIGSEQVIGIARTPARSKHLGIEVRKGDYNNPSELNTALKGVDKVLLVSGMDAPDKRIDQHRNVINAAKANGLQKIVYTSIVGHEERSAFSPIVKSNRQTEEDVKASSLDWVIGRNGIYIEPDLEYLETYKQAGEISNCAGQGKCGYTSRPELAAAYAKMLLDDKHNGQTYNLTGPAIAQAELAELINQAYGTNLTYRPISVADYKKERIAALGDFLGTVIAGIYESMANGAYNVDSDFEKATGRPHLSTQHMIENLKQ